MPIVTIIYALLRYYTLLMYFHNIFLEDKFK